jgi:hypothetical protein
MRSAAFDEWDVHAVGRRVNREKQRSGGRRVRRRGWTKEEQQCVCVLRGWVQATQRFRAYLLLPEEQGPAVPARRICSAAHRLSAVVAALSTRIFSAPTPHQVNAAGCSRCGGCSTKTGRVATVSSAALSRRSSPQPGCGTITSVKAPVGQPWPGSSASSASCPLATVGRTLLRGSPKAGIDCLEVH